MAGNSNVKNRLCGWILSDEGLSQNRTSSAGERQKATKWEPIPTRFLLPGLADATTAETLRAGNGLQVARIHYFKSNAKLAVTTYFVWLEHIEDAACSWGDVSDRLFHRLGLKTPKQESDTLGRVRMVEGSARDCARLVSQAIRGSETLHHDSALQLDRGAFLLAEPRGFACYGDNVKLPDADQFMRFALLFGLAHAYRRVMLKWIRGMGEVLADVDAKRVNPAGAYQALADLREKVAMFDARCYFSNPVSPDRHELFTVMECFMDRLNVHALHEEMAQQLREVSSLAHQKLEAMQQAAAEQQQRNAERLNFRLAFLGIVLALLDLLSHSPEEWVHVLQDWMRWLPG